MSACRCERCRPENPAPTYTAAYRLECLARWVLGRALDERRAFLERFEKNSGQKMALKLKEEIWRLWDAKRKAPGAGAEPATGITQHAETERTV